MCLKLIEWIDLIVTKFCKLECLLLLLTSVFVLFAVLFQHINPQRNTINAKTIAPPPAATKSTGKLFSPIENLMDNCEISVYNTNQEFYQITSIY